MDTAGLVALATVIVAAIAAHLKNRDQDAVVKDLKDQLAEVKKDVADCKQDRRLLMDLLGERRDEENE